MVHKLLQTFNGGDVAFLRYTQSFLAFETWITLIILREVILSTILKQMVKLCCPECSFQIIIWTWRLALFWGVLSQIIQKVLHSLSDHFISIAFFFFILFNNSPCVSSSVDWLHLLPSILLVSLTCRLICSSVLDFNIRVWVVLTLIIPPRSELSLIWVISILGSLNLRRPIWTSQSSRLICIEFSFLPSSINF